MNLQPRQSLSHYEKCVVSDEQIQNWADQAVGAVNRDGMDVVVVPKIPIDRLLFMVAHANDPYRWRAGIARLWRDFKDLTVLSDPTPTPG